MAERHTYNWLIEHQSYPHEQWCLLWPFYRDKHGRAVVNIDGKKQFAYRYMCKLTKGEPPTPLHGCAHSCGNGHLGCINPHHLSWKTQAENMQDCAIHGHQAKNRTGPAGHFSAAEIDQIRFMLQTRSQRSIAEFYKVTESTISDIARGKYYARPPKLNFWTPEEDEKIRDCVARGLSFPQMAAEIGRPKASIMSRVYRLGLTSGRKPNRTDYSTVRKST